MKQEINPNETSRAQAFQMWMKSPVPMVTFTKTFDVTVVPLAGTISFPYFAIRQLQIFFHYFLHYIKNSCIFAACIVR